MPDSKAASAAAPGPPGQPSPTDSKNLWRRWSRARRKVSDDETDGERLASSNEHLVDLLTEFLEPIIAQPGSLVLFYRAMLTRFGELPAEPALEPLADRLGWQHFAITRTPNSGPLTIHPATGAMELHHFGFMQPTSDAIEIPAHHITAALVPGLLFDKQGNRLGHGAGYYDELLARLPDDCLRVGVCWADNVVDLLPIDSHDVPMSHLATEHGVRREIN